MDSAPGDDLAARRRLLLRLVGAEEEQSRALAAVIHDDPIQVMAAACIQVAILCRSLAAEPAIAGRLDELEQTMGIAVAHLRQIVLDLLPPETAAGGLAHALELYVDDLNRDSKTRFRFHDRSSSAPDDETGIVLYRITQHVLGNVRKHARASTVTVTFANRDDGHHVLVEDDGAGSAHDDGLSGTLTRSGLAKLRERAEQLGGRLQIESVPGRGTTVDCWLPAVSECTVICTQDWRHAA